MIPERMIPTYMDRSNGMLTGVAFEMPVLESTITMKDKLQ